MGYALLIAFVSALLAPVLARVATRGIGWLAALSPLASFFLLWLAYDPQQPKTLHLSWAEGVGLSLSFRLDGLSFFFATLITLVGAAVLIYTDGYVRQWKRKGGLFGLLLLFEGAMLGLVLADNLLLLYIFWELTTISSFLLIGIEREKPEARSAALVALLITSAGGLCLLAGGLVLGVHAGGFGMPAVMEAGLPGDRSAAAWATFLIALAALTKSAQFPFHFWLPRAMTAPTPVSTYLHAATMVKAGLYLVARLSPMFEESILWPGMLGLAAAATMPIAAWGTLSSQDAKRLLAYSTLGALSIGMLLLADGGSEAAVAFFLVMLAHAAYKACLFMCAGCVDHATGTRSLADLSGLWRSMPFTTAAAILGIISLAEFGPVLSYIGKEEAIKALGMSHLQWAIAVLAVLATAFVVAAIVLAKIFVGRPRHPREPHEVCLSMWLPALLLGAIGIPLAFLSPAISPFLIGPAVEAVVGAPHGRFALWHGWDWKVGVSLATVFIGVVIALAARPLRELLHKADPVVLNATGHLASGAGFLWRRASRWQAELLEHDRLPAYMMVIFVAVIVATGPLLLGADWQFDFSPSPQILEDIALATMTAIGALATLLLRSRFALVASLSITGFGVSLIFARYAALDIAITQILIEMFTVVLLVGVLRFMPSLSRLSSIPTLFIKGAVAMAAAACACLILLQLNLHHGPSVVSDFYIQEVAGNPHRENVVASIIADFRAFDTFGEITVLATSAIGVLTMVILGRGRGGRK